MTLTKYRNYALNVWERASRRTVLRSRPYRIYIDPINICWLRCPLCPTGQRKMSSQGKMALRDFQRVFDLLGDTAAWVGLYNWGEPLLNDEIYQMIRYVADARVRTIVSTHLSLPFSAEDARGMVRSGLSTLIVSLDGATPETYETYRVGGDLSLVLGNLQLLTDSKRGLDSTSPEIVVQFIPFRHNEHELDAMRSVVERFGARLSIVPATCDMGRVLDTPPEEAVRRNGTWLPADMAYRRYETVGRWLRPVPVCESLWNTAVIRWDGEVFPCCLPYRDEHSLGNIHSVPFGDIWNGARMQHARALFVRGAAADSDSPAACDLCYTNRGWSIQNLPSAGLGGIWHACGNAVSRRTSEWRERFRRRLG